MRERLVISLLVVAQGWAFTRAARADDKMACVQAAETAQEQRTAGRLREARASLKACAREACPPLVHRDCTEWLAEVDAAIPSIVIRVAGPDGDDRTDVGIDLDGRRIADKLEGRAFEVDPGPHVLTARLPDGQSLRRDLVVHTAEKNRIVTLQIEGAAPSRVTPPSLDLARDGSAGPGIAAWASGGVALVATATFAYFGAAGSAEVRDMREECAGHCPASRVDAAYQQLLVADIALGTALVSAGVATYLFVTAPHRSTASSTTRAMSIAPLAGGFTAVWLEHF